MANGPVVMMWGACVLLGAVVFVLVMMLLCYGCGNMRKADTGVLRGDERWGVDDGSVV